MELDSLVANVCTNKLVAMNDHHALDCLTEREIEILSQKAQGLTIKVISYNLNISESTAAFHLSNIRKKLSAQSTEHAVSKFTLMMSQ